MTSTTPLLDHVRGIGTRLAVLGAVFTALGGLLVWRTAGLLTSGLLLAMVGAVGVMGLVALGLGLVVRQAPELHPNLRPLLRGGRAALLQAERELAAAPPSLGPVRPTFTQGFAFVLLPFTVQVRRLATLGWVHGVEQDVRYNGAKVQTNHLARLRFTDQPDLSIAFPDPAERDAFLTEAAARWPGVALGHSPQLERLWRTDKAAFAREVAAARPRRAAGA